MQHTYYSRINQFFIKSLEQCDLEFLRKWRNDEFVSKYLRKIDYISVAQQKQWYADYLKEKGNYFWSIFVDNRIIGALSIYNIHNNVAEIGRLMIGDKAFRGKGFGYLALVSAMKIGFNLLGISSFYLTVYEKNIAAIKTYEKAGFKTVDSNLFSTDEIEYRMELSKKEYEICNPIVKDIEIRSI